MADFSEEDVAAWMLMRVQKKSLFQDDAAWRIKQKFGRKFVYDNQHGNPAIEKKVLDKFRELTGDEIVWSRSERLWRKRTVGDEPGRMQE